MRRSYPFLILGLLVAVCLPIHAADAAATFKAKCAVCHGQDGSGDTVMGKKMGLRALGSADVQKQTDAVLTELIVKGKGKMPAYDGKIPAEDIKALVAHIRSLAK